MILVLGANGQVGRELQAIAGEFPAFSFQFLGRNDYDLAKESDIAKLPSAGIRYCINAAAYTAVDKAESEPELAHQTNALGAERLAFFCKQHHIRLIHLSTDYVFHTQQNAPYAESDATNPQGVYASTKWLGEQLALQTHHDTMVIRTSWVYSSFGNNFAKTMLRLAAERPLLRVVYDQIGTPTYARDLARAALQIIEKTENGEVEATHWRGIYHFSNEGVASWYDFAKAILDIKHLPCKVMPIESKDYPTPVQRPFYSVLNKNKIKQIYHLDIPHWHDSLIEMLKLI